MFDFAAIDFEVANNSQNYAACSIGIVVVRDGKIADVYSSLINSGTSFNPYCVRIHGITEKDVADAPTFAEIWPKISSIIEGLPLVAHNKAFDLRILQGCLDHAGIRFDMPPSLCTLTLSRSLLPNMPSYKLSALCSSFGYTYDHHDACADAKACAALLLHMIATNPNKSFFDFLRAADSYIYYAREEAEPCSYSVSLPEYALFGHCFAFTGDLASMSRDKARAIVQQYGAITPSSVTKLTTVLVVGGYRQESCDYISEKHQKALDMISKGHDVEILYEEDFLRLLTGHRSLSVAPVAGPEIRDLWTYLISHVDTITESFPEIRPTGNGYSLYFYRQKAASLSFSASGTCSLEIDADYVNDNVRGWFVCKEVKRASQTYPSFSLTVNLPEQESAVTEILCGIAEDKFYTANVERFACCSCFEKCSDARSCLHTDDWDYVGCSYRRNLKAGRIFYGENQNI